MNATKITLRTDAAIPLIAALPFRVAMSGLEGVAAMDYNPSTQLTMFMGGRDFSTSREDESAGGFFSSKSDTKKDD